MCLFEISRKGGNVTRGDMCAYLKYQGRANIKEGLKNVLRGPPPTKKTKKKTC